ncbi:MAG TPA: NTP transferase domain-containing protein [Candidatus Eremiobacteraceae bacterium]|nr:NTP transferase domain-containing protein [Candidatus Eremiobacteraceae bacterium]
MISAVIAAAGRLEPAQAREYATDIKALACIGGKTLLATLVDALRGVPEIGRISVVGPRAVREGGLAVDEWSDERASGEENVIAALRSAGGGRCLACAADLPFVTAGAIAALLRLVPPDVRCAYPIFTRSEFLGAFPGARSSFATLADGEWTGGSILVLDAPLMLRNEALIRRGFAARKNLLTLAALLGPALALRYATRRLTVDDVQARLSALIGGNVMAVRGADPALAMDCDEAADFEYARKRFMDAPAR